MTYPNGTRTKHKSPSASCLQRWLHFLPSGGVPKPKSLVPDLGPLPVPPRLRLATSYIHVASRPLAAATAPDALLSLTVAPP